MGQGEKELRPGYMGNFALRLLAIPGDATHHLATLGHRRRFPDTGARQSDVIVGCCSSVIKVFTYQDAGRRTSSAICSKY